ncbi:hypothetical protein, conserved [Babesia ovata]|uniref:C3H1-type domain-containing protein n=1 Tax=Babesia ovata TaxID=189622 RepID=A0A2H6KKF9_9APIC|nr:uncharacterized protein BOVATA_049770 [Babesia ovata]GBE63484.1 hypothetical protein, conserved [Babesia ovata]
MSFLHGVLESVKDDESVTKYDHKTENIDKILKSLSSSIGQGSGGLVTQVTAVSGWLERYEKEVMYKTDSLTSRISIFKTESLSAHKNRIQESKKLTEQLADWKDSLNSLAKEVDIIENDHVKVLDSALKCKIETEIKPVKSVLEALKKSAGNGMLEKQVWTMDAALDAQFLKILGEINKVNDEKNNRLKTMKGSLKEAQKLVDNFDWKYTNQIRQKFDEIKIRVSEVYDALKQNKAVLNNMVASAQEHFKAIKNGVGKDGEPPSSIDKKWTHLKEEIPKIIEKLNGTEDEHDGKIGLFETIGTGIGNYGMRLDGKIRPAIKNIVNKIVDDHGGAVHKLIDGFVTFNKLKHKELNTAGVKEAIKSKIGDIESTSQIYSDPKDVKNTLVSIQQYLTKYALAIDGKLNGGMPEFIEEIKGDPAFKDSSGLKLLHDDIPGKAVKTILTAVKSTVERVKEELKLFTTDDGIHYDLGKNLKDAIDAVNSIQIQLTSTGSQLELALDQVKKKIGELDGVLATAPETGLIHGKLSDIATNLEALDGIMKNDTGVIIVEKQDGDKIMNRLKADIGEKLDDIDVAVGYTNDMLDEAIKKLDNVVREAYETIKQAVHSLFAEQHIADLSALHTLVERKLAEVRKIIDEDKVTGIKGLLKSVNGMLFGINKEGMPQFHKPQTTLLDALKTAVPQPAQEPLKAEQYRDKLSQLSEKSKSYLDNLLAYTELQVKFEGHHKSPTKESQLVRSVNVRLDKLLDYLIKINNVDTNRKYTFDHNSTTYLSELNDSISSLSPSNFHGFHNPLLLDALRRGMTQFTQQLGHAYVNKYSGLTLGDVLEPQTSDKQTTEKLLSTEGRNSAKVCLTILERVFHDLSWLLKNCKENGNWRSLQINTYRDVPLGNFFQTCGYTVNSETGKQTGHLQDKACMTGQNIHELLFSESEVKRVFRHKDADKDKYGSLRNLHNYLDDYYYVTHLEYHPSPRAPSNIHQMLQWLLGLYYNPMFRKVTTYFNELFPKPKGREEVPYSDFKNDELKLVGTSNITPKELRYMLLQVCFQAEKVLVAILGRGHENGRYAVDFYTNADKLDYPSSPASCLDMLIDISHRVYDQLFFVFTQCSRTSDANSWRDCWYGRGVGGSAWSCNAMQCPGQQGDQSATQMHNQKCSQKCDQSVSCGLKSPLQSFLEDGLQGFLPHSFTTPGCKLTCTVSNHRGLPCKTPMGFGDISNVASHTKTGEHLAEVLTDFCGRPNNPLALLCAQLTCLLQRAPQTLDDMFSFYYNFLSEWNTKTEHKRDAFEEAVSKAYFGQPYAELKVYSIWFNSKHSVKSHHIGDLFSLYRCDYGDTSKIICGRYLQPFGMNRWNVFSKKNADKYLSWIVYMTETFYELLKKLYDDCCTNCNKPGTRCYDRGCAKTCPVRYTDMKADVETLEDKHHTKDCKSIANCPFTRPTICKFGFVSESTYNLSNKNGPEKMRTCKDFCRTLERVLSNKISDNTLLAKLIHIMIPDYLWAIRTPFSITLLALWSLSLLYLLHIAVVRLDVLRIRSHLRSPSSHRIAAQSLLAAARVGKIANVKYFSP